MKAFQATSVAISVLLFVNAGQAIENPIHPTPQRLDEAWQSYLTRDADSKPAMIFPFAHCFKHSATRYRLPETLLLAVARGESDFKPGATSSANAIGLMQILWPGTAHHLGINSKKSLFKPCVNVDAGARYLKEMLTRYNGNLHRALAAYNYGPARITVKKGAMPAGAEWYSDYIYRHLLYVLGRAVSDRKVPTAKKYRTERRLPLVTFGTPYRAKAFVANIQQNEPDLRLSWFRTGDSAFKVVMLYGSDDELLLGKQMLRLSGFTVR